MQRNYLETKKIDVLHTQNTITIAQSKSKIYVSWTSKFHIMGPRHDISHISPNLFFEKKKKKKVFHLLYFTLLTSEIIPFLDSQLHRRNSCCVIIRMCHSHNSQYIVMVVSWVSIVNLGLSWNESFQIFFFLVSISMYCDLICCADTD